jgi:hypothetical protein
MGPGCAMEYFIYGVLIASIKQSLSCDIGETGGESGSKSAKLDKIYWLLTDTQKMMLRAKFADARSVKVYEMSKIRSFKDLF